MTTAAVVYLSETFTTATLAERIGEHLRSRGLDTRVASIFDTDPGTLAGVDVLLLGAWTHGLFVIAQHPDTPWVEFARALPPLHDTRVGLFTTYKLRTGSMFRRMREPLVSTGARITLELQRKDGTLDDAGRAALDRFIG